MTVRIIDSGDGGCGRTGARRRVAVIAAAAAAGLAVAACGTAGLSPAGAPRPIPAPAATASLPPPTRSGGPGSCHASGSGLEVLPDPLCTPGARNPAVTPATVASTICSRGWTATVRPPGSVTNRLKAEQLRAYGDSDPVGSYEEDHLIPLELGGAAADPRNLWPEPGPSPNPKDRVEDAARRKVCDGRLGLAAAQQAIATNWIAFAAQLGVP